VEHNGGNLAVEGRAWQSSAVRIAPIDGGAGAGLFELFARVVADGEGYPHLPPLTRSQFEDTWIRSVTIVVGAEVDGQLAGAYYLKPNFPGRGAHIANAGYLVGRAHRGRGIGRLLVEDSIARAPGLGFDAIQFNFVFADNPARRLYERLGWKEIGRIPGALGPTDAVIYWRAVP
jgi:GNAT superfamily N-acetyltransferase